jgi:hypothetical protein
MLFFLVLLRILVALSILFALAIPVGIYLEFDQLSWPTIIILSALSVGILQGIWGHYARH